MFWNVFKFHSKCHEIELMLKASQNSSSPNSGVWIQCFTWSPACNIITVKGEIKKSSMNISHTCYSPSVLLCDRMLQLLFTEEPLNWWIRENSIFYYTAEIFLFSSWESNKTNELNISYWAVMVYQMTSNFRSCKLICHYEDITVLS